MLHIILVRQSTFDKQFGLSRTFVMIKICTKKEKGRTF